MSNNANPFDTDFLDELEQAASDAEQFGVRKNFGQLTITPIYQRWDVIGTTTAEDGTEREKRMPVEITLADYKQADKRNRSLRLVFKVNIQEFNPELTFEYERTVNVGDKDWRQILVPSVQKVFGKDAMHAGKYAETLGRLNGAYVEVHDVPQVKSPDYNTIALAKVFVTKDECYTAFKAHRASFESGGASTSTPATPVAQAVQQQPAVTGDVPDGYSADTWAEIKPQVEAELKSGADLKDIASNWGLNVGFLAKLKQQI